MRGAGAKRRVIIADEGINGTLSGPGDQLRKYRTEMETAFNGVLGVFSIKELDGNERAPLSDLVVKQKKELCASLLPVNF